LIRRASCRKDEQGSCCEVTNNSSFISHRVPPFSEGTILRDAIRGQREADLFLVSWQKAKQCTDELAEKSFDSFGWLMGLEPTTTGITELRPVPTTQLNQALQSPRKPRKSQINGTNRVTLAQN
jgi:hypothetical protein